MSSSPSALWQGHSRSARHRPRSPSTLEHPWMKQHQEAGASASPWSGQSRGTGDFPRGWSPLLVVSGGSISWFLACHTMLLQGQAPR